MYLRRAGFAVVASRCESTCGLIQAVRHAEDKIKGRPLSLSSHFKNRPHISRITSRGSINQTPFSIRSISTTDTQSHQTTIIMYSDIILETFDAYSTQASKNDLLQGYHTQLNNKSHPDSNGYSRRRVSRLSALASKIVSRSPSPRSSYQDRSVNQG